MDSKLTSFVYGPDSIGVGESEISSLTDPTYGSASTSAFKSVPENDKPISAVGEADAGVVKFPRPAREFVVGVGVHGESESHVASGAPLIAPGLDDAPTYDDATIPPGSSSWTWEFERASGLVFH